MGKSPKILEAYLKLLSRAREKTDTKHCSVSKQVPKQGLGHWADRWSWGTADTEMAQGRHGCGSCVCVCREPAVLGIQTQMMSVGSSTHTNNLTGSFQHLKRLCLKSQLLNSKALLQECTTWQWVCISRPASASQQTLGQTNTFC